MRMCQRSLKFLIRNRASPWRAVCTHRDIRRMVPVGELRSCSCLPKGGSNLSRSCGNTLQPGSQRLPGGLSRSAIGCCWSFGRVATLRRWTRARRRGQGCAKRTSKRLDLYGVGVSTIDEGLAISRTLGDRPLASSQRVRRCERRCQPTSDVETRLWKTLRYPQLYPTDSPDLPRVSPAFSTASTPSLPTGHLLYRVRITSMSFGALPQSGETRMIKLQSPSKAHGAVLPGVLFPTRRSRSVSRSVL